jgi:hypothetical protein
MISSERLYYTYARAVDEGDLDTLRSIVTKDVRVTRGSQPALVGVEAFLDIYRAHNALNLPVCKHVVTNIQADRRDGVIETHAYFQATMFEEAGTRMIFGCYDDVHVEQDGKLLIAHKVITVERIVRLPASAGPHYTQVRGAS